MSVIWTVGGLIAALSVAAWILGILAPFALDSDAAREARRKGAIK